jgi:hypothetical protein
MEDKEEKNENGTGGNAPAPDERIAYLEGKVKEIVADRDQWKNKHAQLAAQVDQSGKQPVQESDWDKASKQDLMRTLAQMSEEKKRFETELNEIKTQAVKKEKLSVVQKYAKEARTS